MGSEASQSGPTFSDLYVTFHYDTFLLALLN